MVIRIKIIQWAIRSLLPKFVIDKNMAGLQRLNGYGLVESWSILITGLRYSLAYRETYRSATGIALERWSINNDLFFLFKILYYIDIKT